MDPGTLLAKVLWDVCDGKNTAERFSPTATLVHSQGMRSGVGHRAPLLLAPLRRFPFFRMTGMFSGPLVVPLEKGMMWSNSWPFLRNFLPLLAGFL
jgi:hypothetical protein